MGVLIVEIKMTDFAQAMTNFAKGAPIRQQAGIVNTRMYRGIDDTNSFCVVSDAADETKARAALAKPEVRQYMQEAGIVGPPKIHFVP